MDLFSIVKRIEPGHYMMAAIVLLLIALSGSKYYQHVRPGEYDIFAQCIAKSGATFYGAHWCPHCAAQKEMFGNSADQLPYVECAEPKSDAPRAICTEAKIRSYPTWVLGDGTRLEGTQTLARLADETACNLPQ